MTTPDHLTPTGFDALVGWKEADLSLSLAAFQQSAREILTQGLGFRRQAAFGGNRTDWLTCCETALSATDPHRFFQTHFQPLAVSDPHRPEGLFTGYYEPILSGDTVRSEAFPVPVYGRPDDLVAFTAAEQAETGLSYGRRDGSKPAAYFTRQEIECGALEGKAPVLCYVSSWVDAFFMHVQGQGRVVLRDGRAMRLSYIAKTGHAYRGIGHVLVEKGVVPQDQMSMQVLRRWMAEHPESARQLMWHNPSYIFFQAVDVEDVSLGGIGAAKVHLTPEHSLAVDRASWMFGTPLWLQSHLPPEPPHGKAPFTRLMIAQDTGSAIRGIVRGDVYWGWGERAADIAGYMKSAGHLTALLPCPVAKTLGLA